MFNFLAAHPDVCMSTPKETHYFERYETFDPAYFWKTFYGRCDGEKLVGEATPSNLYVPYVAGRIRAVFPKARLIAILRDPVARAFSHWWMRYAEGTEKLWFEDALESNLRQLEGGLIHERPDAEAIWRDHMAGRSLGEMRWRPYLDAGYYAAEIRRFQALFGADALLILFTESLRSDPAATMTRVWKHVGLPEPDDADYSASPNEALSYRGSTLYRTVKDKAILKVIPRTMKLSVRAWASRGEKPRLEPETEAWLTEFYRAWNDELTELLGERPPWR